MSFKCPFVCEYSVNALHILNTPKNATKNREDTNLFQTIGIYLDEGI